VLVVVLIVVVVSKYVRIFVHGAKKQQSLCAAALDKQKCLQKSLKLYKANL